MPYIIGGVTAIGIALASWQSNRWISALSAVIGVLAILNTWYHYYQEGQVIRIFDIILIDIATGNMTDSRAINSDYYSRMMGVRPRLMNPASEEIRRIRELLKD